MFYFVSILYSTEVVVVSSNCTEVMGPLGAAAFASDWAGAAAGSKVAVGVAVGSAGAVVAVASGAAVVASVVAAASLVSSVVLSLCKQQMPTMKQKTKWMRIFSFLTLKIYKIIGNNECKNIW